MRIAVMFLFLSLFFCMGPADALSEVVVDDMVAPEGGKIMLRAETRGLFLGKGGELVEFFVNGRSLGKNLSGGDGVALKEFIPVKEGLHTVSVKSGSDRDSGALLVVKRGKQVVLIDVDGSLAERPFMEKAKPGSAEAVRRINKRFPVIFLRTGFFGVKAMRAWLKRYGFPTGPVLPWRRGDVFRELGEKEIKIKAVIGGPDVIESAKEYKPRVFSFEPAGDGESVEDWNEIEKNLRRN